MPAFRRLGLAAPAWFSRAYALHPWTAAICCRTSAILGALDAQSLRVLLRFSTSFFRWPLWSSIAAVIGAVLRCYVAERCLLDHRYHTERLRRSAVDHQLDVSSVIRKPDEIHLIKLIFKLFRKEWCIHHAYSKGNDRTDLGSIGCPFSPPPFAKC